MGYFLLIGILAVFGIFLAVLWYFMVFYGNIAKSDALEVIYAALNLDIWLNIAKFSALKVEI